MSTEAIREFVADLEALPISDQQLVLDLVRALKRKKNPSQASSPRHGRNPAVQVRDGLLTFTGTIEAPQTDWLRVVRQEREETFIRQAAGSRERE
jgi:hypothetical protein